MKKKRLLVLILGFFLLLGLVTFLGEQGIFRLFRLKKELARIQEANVQLEKENAKLKEDVERLKHEKRTIEEIARRELGMVKEGEIVYQFKPPTHEKEPSP